MLVRNAAALALVGGALVLGPPMMSFSSTAGSQPVTAAPSLVFDGVTVIDVEQGKLLAAQRVVVTGNRILAMGAARGVPLPPGARVVDGRGKYLIPGLWDMHVHVSEASLYRTMIAAGQTGMREPDRKSVV